MIKLHLEYDDALFLEEAITSEIEKLDKDFPNSPNAQWNSKSLKNTLKLLHTAMEDE